MFLSLNLISEVSDLKLYNPQFLKQVLNDLWVSLLFMGNFIFNWFFSYLVLIVTLKYDHGDQLFWNRQLIKWEFITASFNFV
jgi:hypothetical protein